MSRVSTFVGALVAAATISIVSFLTASPASAYTQNATCEIAQRDATVINAVEPLYPEWAREMAITGKVLVRVDLAPSGALIDASIAESSGIHSLDVAALEAARESRFAPAVLKCVAVGGSYLYRVEFN
jgi:TonB family protein